MALTHVAGLRDKLANLAVDEIDLNTPPGTLGFWTAAYAAEIATLTFSNPAFGAAASAVATASAITKESSATAGTIAVGRIEQGAGASVMDFSVTVTSGGGDIELSSLVLSTGDEVSVTSLTYTAPV